MGGLLHLFDFHQGSLGKKHKKQGSADVAAPRNSIEMVAETWRNHYAVENCEQQDLPKRSYYPTDASIKKLISRDLSKKQNSKQNAPSIVARLMGMDIVPVDTIPEEQPFQDTDDKIKFIDKKIQIIEKVSSVRTPKKSKSKSSSIKKEYRSYKDTYFRYWSSGGTNLGKPRPRVHPQEKELQKFKKDFEAWQTSRFLECARVVQLGNIPEQWLAQLDLTKEKMSIYESSRKDAIEKSGELKRDGLRSRSLHVADFERLGYKKDVFLPKHKESYSFSGMVPGRDLDQQLSLRDFDIDSEKSCAPSKIVVLKPGPDSFSTNDESWVTSSSSMDDRDCIEDLLEEVRERLKYEMQGNALKKGPMVRGGGIETPFKEKPAYAKQSYQPVAKENTSRDLGRKLFRSESARFYQSEKSLMSELAPSSPDYMSRDTRNFLSERLRNIIDGEEKHQNRNLNLISDFSPRERLFDDARGRLEKARDILNAEQGQHYWRDGNYRTDTQSRSFRYEPISSNDGNIQEQPSPRNLVRSLSAPLSGMSFGKLLLEDRFVSPGTHIKRKHEAFENFPMDVKDQRKERFNLREKVSSLKHSLSLRRMLFSRKLESMDFSERNEFDSAKDIMNGPTVMSSFNDRNDNSTELPPSPASVCSSYHEEFWKPVDNPSPASMSDMTSVEDQSVGNVFKEISSNLTELRKKLNQLDYEGSEISQITTVTEEYPSELEVNDLENEAEVYIKNLLVTSGLYDGSWVKSFSRWDPYVKPMGNWVFEKVEESYQKPTYENEVRNYDDDCSLEHKLLFDLLNEALTVVLAPPRTLSKFRRKITDITILPHPQGRKLLEQVWDMVCEYLYPSSYTDTSCYSFEDLVAHDLHVMPWSSLLEEETIDIGKELEFQIIGDLVEELLMDMQF
ncbi:uncharacterized protein [Spinacia oleracea]|uniref:Uncharacterized protein LOC110786137 isoform X1 n=1 Tax=Spinacia oleracea TaxID=3562 RepID=A0A9R0IBY2_SPIOL|nr:uncharacterized protein LOC110786137 isoform X1 [Spinacia oleracea]XP_021846360.1 uncharacterized protein LOC110786137 isoform X1 [Spinacia oleracea]XP_021846361.1 uncharacterized protein LOC110786137 isoform X1 [Spinacia oleracea]